MWCLAEVDFESPPSTLQPGLCGVDLPQVEVVAPAHHQALVVDLEHRATVEHRRRRTEERAGADPLEGTATIVAEYRGDLLAPVGVHRAGHRLDAVQVGGRSVHRVAELCTWCKEGAERPLRGRRREDLLCP